MPQVLESLINEPGQAVRLATLAYANHLLRPLLSIFILVCVITFLRVPPQLPAVVDGNNVPYGWLVHIMELPLFVITLIAALWYNDVLFTLVTLANTVMASVSIGFAAYSIYWLSQYHIEAALSYSSIFVVLSVCIYMLIDVLVAVPSLMLAWTIVTRSPSERWRPKKVVDAATQSLVDNHDDRTEVELETRAASGGLRHR